MRNIEKKVNSLFVNIKYLHFESVNPISNEWFLRYVNLCYSNGESRDCRQKLPKYCANVPHYAKQGNLNGSNVFRLLHHVTKSSKRKTQGVEAVEITSDDEGSVVGNWSRNDPDDDSQNQYCEVDYEADKV